MDSVGPEFKSPSIDSVIPGPLLLEVALDTVGVLPATILESSSDAPHCKYMSACDENILSDSR